MKLDLKAPGSFATGACYYDDYPPNDDSSPRLVIPLRLIGDPAVTNAVVDTGAPWSILDPSHAQRLENYVIDDTGMRIKIRGRTYVGDLWRIPVEILSDEGQGLLLEANFFVPRIDHEIWSFPEFIGLQGFLDRIRFAVDPEENLFYFGALGDA